MRLIDEMAVSIAIGFEICSSRNLGKLSLGKVGRGSDFAISKSSGKKEREASRLIVKHRPRDFAERAQGVRKGPLAREGGGARPEVFLFILTYLTDLQ